MTVFRHKHVHKCISQSKTSIKIAATSAANTPRLIQMIITSNTQCTH